MNNKYRLHPKSANSWSKGIQVISWTSIFSVNHSKDEYPLANRYFHETSRRWESFQTECLNIGLLEAYFSFVISLCWCDCMRHLYCNVYFTINIKPVCEGVHMCMCTHIHIMYIGNYQWEHRSLPGTTKLLTKHTPGPTLVYSITRHITYSLLAQSDRQKEKESIQIRNQ